MPMHSCVCVFICACQHAYIRMHVQSMYVCVRIYKCIRISECINAREHAYAYVYVCICVCMHAYHVWSIRAHESAGMRAAGAGVHAAQASMRMCAAVKKADRASGATV